MAASTRLLALALLVVLALKAVVAQGPPSGKYMLLSEAIPPIFVGSHNEGYNSPVILGGENNVWTIERMNDGIYIFTLQQAGKPFHARSVGDHLFMSPVPVSPSVEWRVQNRDGDTYSIVASSSIPPMAWTTRAFGSDPWVVLEEFNPSEPGQRWKFIQRQQ
ncbi:hypothetical protein BGZ80_000942 [Entomortierella chlamydospora]|uniref:Ricin B lectin domain-containing protein n=1 Tax=Entomortierella chlamydospora TaxID=101097 RepID=A0A9P6MSC1_9FUNG|nr:hypothetical protein BGZ80_000942 [Entomortierella chlamydospora]